MNNTDLPSFLSSPDDVQFSFVWTGLRRAGYELNEESLLAAVDDNRSPQLVHYAVIGLKKYGTERSLDVLKRLVHYPREAVQTTAVEAIGKIARGKETPLYSSLLDDPKYRAKMYPMIVIWEVGTKEALPAVMRFAERVISGKIRLSEHKLYYGYIIEFLKRYPSEEVNAIVDKLTEIQSHLR